MTYDFFRNEAAVIISYYDDYGTTMGTMAIPVGKTIATSDKRDIITLKLLSTRKSILAFKYSEILNPESESPEDAVEKLNEILNEN